MSSDFEPDIDAIHDIAAIPTILEVVCRTTGMGFAAVARVTEDRWVVCRVLDTIDFGLQPGGELAIETTICNEIRQSHQPVVIDHVDEDPQFCGHHTPAKYGFQSYISMPIILPGGRFFGTLCAIDPRPARVSAPEIVGMFKLFAELIAAHLDSRERLVRSEASLTDERRTAELREQFIAVLGHDLRNPLASIEAGAKMLARQPIDEKAAHILTLMQASALRMRGLIDNVLDFARGRLGGGLPLAYDNARPLQWMLEQVVAEIRASWPDRVIETDFAISASVDGDYDRLAQLFSNLLGNAVVHGAADHPIRVRAATGDGVFELSVANAGEPIPEAAMERLFQPFHRVEVRPNMQGLGLGLYIASEIARAHCGTLIVSSEAGETRFTLRMPVSDAGAT